MFTPKVTEVLRHGQAASTLHERQRRLVELSLSTCPPVRRARWDERTRTLGR